MLTAEPNLVGFEIPTAQEARDEKIRRLMEVLRLQYGGDLSQFYAAKAKRPTTSETAPEIPWSVIVGTIKQRSSKQSESGG